ncbi:hypothetical protein LZS85_07295 [Aliivibrio fischeri]|uniref:hypothetical protein n=1 Tax=Aliivibrio fischeri TaxID=668 RepID=UPI001F1FC28C|nr:hypothetical protein [Aliivibrio fischeri]MCE7565910.1 hypothetical protein [Aliivibrio fischeri]
MISIIEDDEYKYDSIKDFLLSIDNNIMINTANSVKGAKKLVTNNNSSIILLDMTLPTFDITKESTGGRPQGFGGIEVLRYMEMIDNITPVIIVTQFQTFEFKDETQDISYLYELLEEENFINFKGIVQFSSSTDNWKNELKSLLDEYL